LDILLFFCFHYMLVSCRLVTISIQPARLKQALDATRADGAELVIIDTPPRAADAAMAGAQAADLILIPTRPSR
jgi:chromosome partitioning protein